MSLANETWFSIDAIISIREVIVEERLIKQLMLIKLVGIWAWLMKIIFRIIQPRCCNVVLMVTLKVIYISIVLRLVYWLKVCAFRASAIADNNIKF